MAPVEVVRVGSAFLVRRRSMRGSEEEVSFRDEAIMRGVQPAPSWGFILVRAAFAGIADGRKRDAVLERLDQSLCDRRGFRLWEGGCRMRPSGWEVCHRRRVVWQVWDLPGRDEHVRTMWRWVDNEEDGACVH